MFTEKGRKCTAAFLLMVMTAELLMPSVSYALTSGPAQPEMQKFEAAGVTDMVDLFTGDLKYNIPLMDVDGYPVNLSYNSGTGLDDEAGWVGAGWTLNPGAMNRSMRGLPDDFDGSKGDYVAKENYRKEFKKVGAQLTLKPSLFGWERGSASVKVNVYKDNYYGMGASVGASIDFNLAANTKTGMTAGLGLDVNSDVRNGVDVSPNFSIEKMFSDQCDEPSSKVGLSGGFTYNTRGGLKSTTLGASFSTLDAGGDPMATLSSSAEKYFGQTYTPSIGTNSANYGFTLSADFGGTFFGVFAGIGGAGSYYKENNLQPSVSVPAYGYLNYIRGRKNPDALLDFNREKDGPFLPSAPAIPVPVSTHDLFAATSQEGAQQFRPYFNGNYVVFDNQFTNKSDNFSAGVTIGAGNTFKGGARISATVGGSESKKWTENNNYLTQAEADFTANTLEEPVAFRAVGDKTRNDQNAAFYNNIGNYDARKVQISGSTTSAVLKGRNNQVTTVSQPIKKLNRDKRVASFSYLTAEQASRYALDKTINGVSRRSAVRKDHHLSEITVTGNDGKRMVYGVPVYNLSQTEVTFAKAPAAAEQATALKSGLVTYSATDASKNNRNGRDWMYSRTITPGYATSFLLSAILSPDYVDKTNDGITDDDAGTAVKFSYTKQAATYNWRAPYKANQANYNEGFLSDAKDDKASYVYGTKENWFLSAVESKTMIAFFYTSDRQDGLGVAGETGGISTASRVRKLDSIKLYSKADWVKNGATAIPVKTAHLRYDYSLFRGVPNNQDNPAGGVNTDITKGGKLTLKKVWFTFGYNTRGTSNPYEFTYDLRPVNNGSFPANTNSAESNDLYTERQVDRWGIYKQSFYNHLVNGQPALSNSEFPYVPQENINTSYSERDMADKLASKWQLTGIVTPAGSVITAEYESDDYGFVQNKRAMQMCFLKGITAVSGTDVATGLINADKLTIELPEAVTDINDFRTKYLRQPDGSLLEKIFYKIYVNLDGRGRYEYVHGYAAIDPASAAHTVSSDGKTVFLVVKKVDGYNPVAKNGWQLLRTSLPQFAYDSYDNSDVGNDAKAAITSLIASLGNLRELVQPFDTRAKNRGFADGILVSKSMVRLFSPSYKKIGGGARVKKVQISDEWNAISGGKTSVYGQLYRYVTEKDGKEISSGVAAYEPQIGNEENPFHEPVDFTEKVHWGSDRYHYIEKPFCESYFPGAGVGYSRVTVVAFGNDYASGGALVKHTGEVANEFYTARDFPTLVENLTLDQVRYENSMLLKLFSCTYINKVTTSQGFRVELNDMHGKPKSVKVYNKGGDLISSNEYFYRVKDNNAELKELKNEVDVLNVNGSISNVTVGTDIDFVTDVRQSRNESVGGSVGAYVGGMVTFIPFVPFIPYAAVNANASISKEHYNSVATVKVVHRYGIVERIKAMQNGSVIQTENLLWDGETGEVVLSGVQNEFDKYTYSFNYPAWMAYDGMAGAYKNIGLNILLSPSGGNGNVNAWAAYLVPGDELVNAAAGVESRAWVIKAGDGLLHIIDNNGDFVNTAATWQVVRSGRRNMPAASAGTVVSLTDPRSYGSVDLSSAKRILEAKATIFKEEWAVPVTQKCSVCPTGYALSEDGTTCYKDTTAQYIPPVYQVCAATRLGDYSSCGSAIYSAGYSVDGTVFQRSFIALSNPFWIGTTSDHNYYCNYSPATTGTGGGAAITALSRTAASSNGDSLSGSAALRSANSAAAALAVPYEGPLNRCGIWTCPAGSDTPYSKWIGFSRTITAPATKTYYIGMAADNNFRFKVDGTIIREETSCSNGENFKIWHIYPVSLTAGQHIIEMEGRNCGSSASFGAEIYNNTPAELAAATSYSGLNLVFSTKDMIGLNYENGVYVCPSGYALNTTTTPYTCRKLVAAVNVQPNDPAVRLNPYVSGVLGNWRPWVNYVYASNREQKPGNANQPSGTDIRANGYYAVYSPFWNFGSKLTHTIPAASTTLIPADSRWIWSLQSVAFDEKGNEIENVDAMGKYGAALYGYKQSVAVAIAENARKNEIAFDGFEDYNFRLQSATAEYCPNYHLDFGFTQVNGVWTSAAGKIVSAVSHSGKYSYQINGNVFISKAAGSAVHAASVLGYDATGRYKLLANEQKGGFAPVAGKRYLLSFWVNDHAVNTANNKIEKLQVRINGTSYDLSNKTVPVVEGWKRLDLVFTAAAAFTLELIPSGTIEIDDLRLLPFSAQLKSYIYDDVNQRLTAQHDENNFTIFYEYDDDGTLVRMKKETEKGIMTIKETRQSFRIRP